MNCILCNNETYEIYDKQFDIIYYRCKTCKFIFEDENYHVDFNKERDVYDLHNNSIEDIGYVKMLTKFIESFESFVKGKKLLEYGSGPEPVFSKLMEMRDYDVTKFDLHYFNDLLYLEKKYDVITSTEVFEHFKNPIQEIEKLVSLLNTNGILAIMTQFPKDDNHFIDWWYRRDETHISFYSKESFAYICERFNLSMVYTNDKDYMILIKK